MKICNAYHTEDRIQQLWSTSYNLQVCIAHFSCLRGIANNRQEIELEKQNMMSRGQQAQAVIS
jgi:hypothetical protein